MKVTTGRVLVRIIPNEEPRGLSIVEPEKNQWGEVVDIGPPSMHQYTREQMKRWREENVHPCDYPIGAKVLLSGTRGIQLVRDDSTYVLMYQDEVGLWE